MAQPDIPAITANLQAIQDQVSLVANMPTNGVLADRVIALDQRINHNQNIILERIQRMEHTLITQIQNSHRDLASRIDKLQQENGLLPMSLYNSGISQRAPLRYPPGLVVKPGLPATAYDLSSFTIPQCIEAIGMLALPALPANPTITTRRRAIGQYLGVPVE